jgi:hypothetical protein
MTFKVRLLAQLFGMIIWTMQALDDDVSPPILF